MQTYSFVERTNIRRIVLYKFSCTGLVQEAPPLPAFKFNTDFNADRK